MHNHKPPYPSYPYDKHCCCDHDYCDNHSPIRHPHPLPSSGFMEETTFILHDAVPYIYDNGSVTYGQRVSVSENVNTRVTQRRDDSCINLSATFDLTSTITPNLVNEQFIIQTIQSKYQELEGILPVMKSMLFMTVHYTIYDYNGDLTYSGAKVVDINYMKFHPTDVDDYFVSSFSGSLVTNIPQFDYQGLYTISIDSVTLDAVAVDVKSLLDGEELNPYYQFINNNTKIVIQHDTVENVTDENFIKAVMLAECKVNKSFTFQANVTTRLKIAYKTYISDLTAVPNTFNIWDALTNPSKKTIEQLTEEIELLKEELNTLKTFVDENCVIKVEGKDLSTNDYTDEAKTKVDAIQNVIVVKSDKSEFPENGNVNTVYVCPTGVFMWNPNESVYYEIPKTETVSEGPTDEPTKDGTGETTDPSESDTPQK